MPPLVALAVICTACAFVSIAMEHDRNQARGDVRQAQEDLKAVEDSPAYEEAVRLERLKTARSEEEAFRHTFHAAEQAALFRPLSDYPLAGLKFGVEGMIVRTSAGRPLAPRLRGRGRAVQVTSQGLQVSWP